MMRRVLGLCAAALAVLGVAPARACSFVERSVDASFSRADVVFVGTVSSVEEPRARRDVQRAAFIVHEIYKGRLPGNVIVRTAASSSACGVAFAPGERYSIFGMLVRGDLRTDASGALVGDAELAASTHQPIARYAANAASTPLPIDPASRAGPIAAAMLLILVAVAGHVARRRIQRHRNWHPHHAI